VGERLERLKAWSPKKKIVVFGSIFAFLVVVIWTRPIWPRFFPKNHTGVVKRIKPFAKSGHFGNDKNSKQRFQFAIIFEDGFDCEGYDTSFAAIEEGDTIQIRGYPDWSGWPIIDPEWGECDEAQLIKLIKGHEDDEPLSN
jgi:hypothetical protein